MVRALSVSMSVVFAMLFAVLGNLATTRIREIRSLLEDPRPSATDCVIWRENLTNLRLVRVTCFVMAAMMHILAGVIWFWFKLP